jgi:hypothetical protein
MGYTVENKQDLAAQLVLLTTQNNFAQSKGVDQSVANPVSAQANTEVYFQIED